MLPRARTVSKPKLAVARAHRWSPRAQRAAVQTIFTAQVQWARVIVRDGRRYLCPTCRPGRAWWSVLYYYVRHVSALPRWLANVARPVSLGVLPLRGGRAS